MGRSVRMEVLHHGANERREYWTDRSGRVLLARRRGQPFWTARVGRKAVLVTTAEGATRELAEMDLRHLAHRVALESDVQVVFDEESEWQQDATGWPVRVVRRPPRPTDSCSG